MAESVTPEDQDTSSAQDTQVSGVASWSTAKRVIIVSLAFVVTIILAVGTAWFLENPAKNWQAQRGLEQVFESRSDMMLYTNSLHESTTDSAVQQKRLGVDGEMSESATFVFGPTDRETSTQPLDITVSFGEQRSMDFLRMNSMSIQNLIRSGIATVSLETAPNAHTAYSILAPEALALVVEKYEATELWHIVMQLVALSVELADDGENDPDVIADRISEKLLEYGYEISPEEILSGSYGEWIHNAAHGIADDSYGLPIIHFAGERISPETVDILNPETFSNHIWSKSLQN